MRRALEWLNLNLAPASPPPSSAALDQFGPQFSLCTMEAMMTTCPAFWAVEGLVRYTGLACS